MSLWSDLGRLVASRGGRAFNAVIEAIRTVFAGDPERRRQVAFSIAMIALSAKMAKADGVVTQDEVRAFRQLFDIPPAEARNVARLYDRAKQDVAGFESYAGQIVGLCSAGETDCPLLEDVIDGLLFIATADGIVHEHEIAYLHRIAEIFHISEAHFRSILARHTLAGEGDPYLVLGIGRDASTEAIRKRYRDLVKENHPDSLIARGLPAEFIAIATRRLARINDAYSMIERGLKPA